LRSTSKKQLAHALGVIEFFDVPPRQTEILVFVCEYLCNDEERIGIEWDAWKRAFGGVFAVGYNEIYKPGPAPIGSLANIENLRSPFVAGAGVLTVDATVLANALNYMEERGLVTLKQRTSITALNDKEAKFNHHVPADFGKYDLSGSVTTAAAVPNHFPSDKPYAGVVTIAGGKPVILEPDTLSGSAEGISLALTPSIGLETIELNLSTTVTSRLPGTGLLNPPVATTVLEDHVSLRDCQTFKLCTYDRIEQANIDRGVSGLRRLPVVGGLFNKKSDVTRNKRVVVFLAPTPRSQEEFHAKALDLSNETGDLQLRSGIPLLPGDDALNPCNPYPDTPDMRVRVSLPSLTAQGVDLPVETCEPEEPCAPTGMPPTLLPIPAPPLACPEVLISADPRVQNLAPPPSYKKSYREK